MTLGVFNYKANSSVTSDRPFVFHFLEQNLVPFKKFLELSEVIYTKGNLSKKARWRRGGNLLELDSLPSGEKKEARGNVFAKITGISRTDDFLVEAAGRRYVGNKDGDASNSSNAWTLRSTPGTSLRTEKKNGKAHERALKEKKTGPSLRSV